MPGPAYRQPIHAAGEVPVGGLTPTSPRAGEGARNWTVGAPAASVFAVTLADAIDPTSCVVMCGVRGATAGSVRVTAQTATVISFTTADVAGMASDRAFWFVVLRVSN